MPQLTIRFTGLCLFVPKKTETIQHKVELVDVLLINAWEKMIPTLKHKKNPAACEVHVPHVPRVIYDADDVDGYEALNPMANFWSISRGHPAGKVSWLLTPVLARRQIVRLFDGAARPSGDVTLLGEDDGNSVEKPSEKPDDPKKRWYRWMPNVHRVFPGMGLVAPACPKIDASEEKIHAKAIAKMRLWGGSLGSEDVQRRTNGSAQEAKSFRFESSLPGTKPYRQALATAAHYTLDLTDRLTLACGGPSGTSPYLRVVFKNRPVTLTVSNDPLDFMEHLIPYSDYELSYEPMTGVKEAVVPSDAGAAGTKPCSCTTC